MDLEYDSSSESESSVIEQENTIDKVNPMPSDPYPLPCPNSRFLPPLSEIRLKKSIKSTFNTLLSSPSLQKLHHLLFWQVFYKKLKPDTTLYLQEKTSKKLAKYYVKVLIHSMSQEVSKDLDPLPLYLGHAIHHELYEVFKNSRYYFDTRFVIDCYKIIFLELSGIIVTDSFIQNSTKKLFGNYFMRYLTVQKKKPDNSAQVLNKKLEKQMNGVPGGVNFAKELADKLRPVQVKRNELIQDEDGDDKVLLPMPDKIIADRVTRHLSEKNLKRSVISDSAKVFNCNKLSPLLSRQINSSSKELPFKHRFVTPHKIEKYYEGPPSFLKVLQRHCEEKSSLVRLSRKSSEKETKQIKKQKVQKTVEMSPLGPMHSPCFSEVFKLRTKLSEFNHYAVLLGGKRNKL